MKSFENSFLEMLWTRKNVFGLRRRVRIACEPIPWSGQGYPKFEEKQSHISEPLFYGQKLKIFKKCAPKGLQKGDFIESASRSPPGQCGGF